MKVIISHNNIDFDGLASMIGAKKLFPYAEMLLPEKLSPDVEHFLAIYKDTFHFKKTKTIDWERVTEVIVVDTNHISRIGHIRKHIRESMKITVYDHHIIPEQPLSNNGKIEKVGAAITLIAEELMEKNIQISPFEATIFALGSYSDTGAFTFDNTTSRDLKTAAWFLDMGASLSIVEQFRQVPLNTDAHSLFQELIECGEISAIDSVEIFISYFSQDHYTGHLAHITSKLMEVTGADAVFSIVKMGNKTYITARSSNDRINVLPIIKKLNGGGHPKAASAMNKNNELDELVHFIKEDLPQIVSPAITAESLMSSPVKVVAPDTTIAVLSKMLYRYGHTGFPVIEHEEVVGIISRRDVDKALHHGLGHAPVKGYMTRKPFVINKSDSLETIQEYMIKENVGRLPVTDDGKIVGIVSRSDVIRALHGKNIIETAFPSEKVMTSRNLRSEMKEQLSPSLQELLSLISKDATEHDMKAYLIGGMVRDLLLHHNNEDMDIVIEGDSIQFAECLQDKYGGHLRIHEEFRTATWRCPSGFSVDLTSARIEYYDFPAALPKVEMSTIREDLFRRDFTINAMGISLHEDSFGQLIDYFHGLDDLLERKIKVLYNLSFVEDPTRILRAIRFESRFDFSMDSQTESLAMESANNLLSVSNHRIASELERIFVEENPVYSIERLYSFTIPTFLFSERDKKEAVIERFSRLHHLLLDLEEHHILPSSAIWIAYMLYMTPLNERSFTEVEEYALSKNDVKLLRDLQTLLDDFEKISQLPDDLGKWHERFSLTNNEALIASLPLLPAESSTLGAEYLIARDRLQVAVTGKDLIEEGMKPNPQFKRLLLYGEMLQLRHPQLNKKAIIEKIKNHSSNNDLS